MMSKLREYLSVPVILPRWVLMLKYLCFILIGLGVHLASSPSLDTTTPDYLTPLWSDGIMLASAIAFIGALNVKFRVMETWAVLALAALLLGYAAAPIQLVLAGDTDKLAYSLIALTLSLLPCARFFSLAKRGGNIHHG